MPSAYLRFPAAPNLPLAPLEWEARYGDQHANVLRLYFNQLSNSLQQLSGTHGGRRLSFPFGSFYDNTTQAVASTTTAYTVNLGSTAYSNGVKVVSGSKITAEHDGFYNLQFSLQLNNNSNAPQDADVWVRHNGIDIPSSNSRFGLAARKNIGDPFHTVAALNFMHALNAGDYLELIWCTTSTDVSVVNYAAPTGPARPAIPSAIVTLSFVSALG